MLREFHHIQTHKQNSIHANDAFNKFSLYTNINKLHK